ncbi:MAG: bifunctional oligoribonuclease/PAP phosphatase NrnA [Oscillospiraceae bacterium]|nr:bifunctional oligoribonuclease/PAP phosphatase NrnA [Oscillospiraceae bacterium]
MSDKAVLITREETVRRLEAMDNVLIFTHRRPDGDTVGSAAALCIALRSLGKRAYIYENSDNIARLLPYLDGLLQPEGYDPDFYVSVDIATSRLFPYGAEDYAQKIDLAIDHHLTGGSFGKEACVEPERAACGELMYDLLDMMGCITPQTALPLYVAIATDTGCFLYSNTTPSTHEITAKLMAQGIDFYSVNHRMFETKTKCRLKLEAMLMERANFYDGGTIAITALTNEMSARAGGTADDEDDLASLLRSIEGVEAAVTIREQANGHSKISVRTHEGENAINAAEVCMCFGGGGHIRAAGGLIEDTPDNAEQIVLEAIRRVRGNV